MNLKTYFLQKRGRQSALSKKTGAHMSDLSRWADGSRPIPVPFGASIEAGTDGLVTRQEMFPNEWKKIWPELMSETKQKQPNKKSKSMA